MAARCHCDGTDPDCQFCGGRGTVEAPEEEVTNTLALWLSLLDARVGRLERGAAAPMLLLGIIIGIFVGRYLL